MKGRFSGVFRKPHLVIATFFGEIQEYDGVCALIKSVVCLPSS